MSKSRIKNLSKAVVCGFLITLTLGLCGFSGRCDVIRSSVLRLHILANSDSETDQQLKIMVRDAIQNEAGYIFDGAENIDDATGIVEQERERLLTIARRVVREQGYDYAVDLVVMQEYFETRTYDEVTLPAGTYTTVKIIIGEGEGKNWWCVMFPPLCVPVATGGVETDDSVSLEEYLDENGKRIVESNGKFKVGFKIVEIYERLFK